MKFRLSVEDRQRNKTGAHLIGNRLYHAGEVVESDRPLDKLFKNKFEKVAASTPAAEGEFVNIVNMTNNPPVPVPHAPALKQGVEGEDIPENVSSPSIPQEEGVVSETSEHGKDVSSKYPNAHFAGLRVFFDKKTKLFTITDNEDVSVVVKTTRGTTNVSKFLAKQLS